MSGRSQYDVKTTNSDGQHGQELQLSDEWLSAPSKTSRYAETLQMNLVAYAVACSGKTNAIFCSNILKIAVVVCVLKSGVKVLVVSMAYQRVRSVRGQYPLPRIEDKP